MSGPRGGVPGIPVPIIYHEIESYTRRYSERRRCVKLEAVKRFIHTLPLWSFSGPGWKINAGYRRSDLWQEPVAEGVEIRRWVH